MPSGTGNVLIHQTDLFRPHEDPDDHWDLATAFALHLGGEVELAGIVIDAPPPHHAGEPDLPGLTMLTEITGVDVPVAIGSAEPYGQGNRGRTGLGAELILSILDSSDRPVIINLVGTCRDVAVAAGREPALFEKKCRTIVLNAGTGYAASEISDEVEYNVKLDIEAFRAVLQIPCPILWCPCFERLGVGLKLHTHGTHYRLDQRDVLPDLSEPLRGYLAYMYSRDENPDWSRWLESDRVDRVLESQLDVKRPMWSTVGQLMTAGLVSDGGQSFTFDPVSVECRANGTTTWMERADSRIRKFRILDPDLYPAEMAAKLKELLTRL